MVAGHLALWAMRLPGATAPEYKFVQDMLRNWQQDKDLAGLRDEEALKSLSPEEREVCRKFWAAVETLEKKAQPAP